MSLAEIIGFVHERDRDTYDLFAQQGDEATIADVERFEARIGFTLPDEFREFAVHPLGGLYIEAKDSVWPEAEPYAVGPFWSFLRGVMVYSLSSAAPEWLQMEKAWAEMKEQGCSDCVPFLRLISDSAPLCFRPDGSIIRWSPGDPEDPERINGSFYSILADEIADLESRVERKRRGEDKEFDK